MNKTRCLNVLLCLAFCSFPAGANDFGVAGIGGSWRPLKGEHRSIRLVRETVRIEIGLKYDNRAKENRSFYTVTADLDFYNRGPATTVSMAFPERGEGDTNGMGQRSGFSNFVSLVDGKPVKVRRVTTKLAENDLEGDYQALWVKQVSFARHQRRLVRVSYQAEPGSAAGVGRFAAYDFTGGNWSGQVEESRLSVALHLPHNRFTQPVFNGKPLTMVRRGKLFTYHWKRWQAEGHFRFWFELSNAPEMRKRAR